MPLLPHMNPAMQGLMIQSGEDPARSWWEDSQRRQLEAEQAKEAAMTQAATGAGASGLAASTLAGFNWPGLTARATPNIAGPLGVLAGMLMPGKLNNPEADPNWRNKLYPGVAGAQGSSWSGQTEPWQDNDYSIVGQMKKNAGYF